MDLNPNQETSFGKELRCSDCGYGLERLYSVQSLRCHNCGNIEFLATSANPLKDIPRAETLRKDTKEATKILTQRVLEQVRQKELRSQEDPVARFLQKPDGQAVEELLYRYQKEWPLWVELTKNFSSAEHHAAYLTCVAGAREYDLASTRYAKHRSVMALVQDERWQATVADKMLERIQAISLIQMERETKAPAEPKLRKFLQMGWLCIGLMFGTLFLKLFLL